MQEKINYYLDKVVDQVKKDLNPTKPQEVVHTASNFTCPFCQSSEGYTIQKKTSVGGWIVFVVLLIIFFPLCFIGLFITDEHRFCQHCKMQLS